MIKCPKCAELSNCWIGQNGGKEKCPCYSPKDEEKNEKEG